MRNDQPEPRSPGNTLTVIIRDDGPMAICGDAPSYRSVRVPLTPHQMDMLGLVHTYAQGEIWFAESVSRCFIEAD